jgi:hypothetical protein
VVTLVPADESRDKLVVTDLRVDLLEVTREAYQLHLSRLVAGQQLVVVPRQPHHVGRLGRFDNLGVRISGHGLRTGLYLGTWRHRDSD